MDTHSTRGAVQIARKSAKNRSCFISQTAPETPETPPEILRESRANPFPQNGSFLVANRGYGLTKFRIYTGPLEEGENDAKDGASLAGIRV